MSRRGRDDDDDDDRPSRRSRRPRRGNASPYSAGLVVLWVVLGVGGSLCFLCCLGVLVTSDRKDAPPIAGKREAEREPQTTIDATDLGNQHHENPAVVLGKFKGKRIELKKPRSSGSAERWGRLTRSVATFA